MGKAIVPESFRGYKAVFVVLALSIFAMPVSAYALERNAIACAADSVSATVSSSVAESVTMESTPDVHPNIIVIDPLPCRIVFKDCDLQPMMFEVNDEGIVRVFEKDLPSPEREGYAFSGWYMDELRKAPFLDSDEPYRVLKSGEVALFPLWTKLQPDPNPPSTGPDPNPDPSPPIPGPDPDPVPAPAPEPLLENPGDQVLTGGFDTPFGIVGLASRVEGGAEQEASVLDDSERASVDAESLEQAEEELSAQSSVDGLERASEESLPASDAEEVPVLEIALLAGLGAALLGLSVSIALDVRVLVWYAGKKKAVQAESGVKI